MFFNFKKEEENNKKKYTSQERIKMCEECEKFFHPTRQCKVCFCFMDIKTKMKNKTCPEGKW
tara:strand:- start:142 stop:327 length:186 start_codon:yes stop_codon:yes gene_type:complete